MESGDIELGPLAHILPFVDSSFVIASIVIVAVVKTFSDGLNALRPDLAGQPWAKQLLIPHLNILLGLILGLPSGFLYGGKLTERLLVGICAGFLSSFTLTVLRNFLGKVTVPFPKYERELPPSGSKIDDPG